MRLFIVPNGCCSSPAISRASSLGNMRVRAGGVALPGILRAPARSRCSISRLTPSSSCICGSAASRSLRLRAPRLASAGGLWLRCARRRRGSCGRRRASACSVPGDRQTRASASCTQSLASSVAEHRVRRRIQERGIAPVRLVERPPFASRRMPSANASSSSGSAMRAGFRRAGPEAPGSVAAGGRASAIIRVVRSRGARRMMYREAGSPSAPRSCRLRKRCVAALGAAAWRRLSAPDRCRAAISSW